MVHEVCNEPKNYSDGLKAQWLKLCGLRRVHTKEPKIPVGGQMITNWAKYMVHNVCKGPKEYSGGLVAPWLKLCRLSRVCMQEPRSNMVASCI